MRKTLLILFLFFSITVFGQYKYSNEDLSVYKKIIHENSTKYKYVMELNNGKIVQQTTFWNKKFRSTHQYSYDKNSNITRDELVEFYIKDTATYDNQPIIFINTYNDLNQLASIREYEIGKEERAIVTIFLDYNAMGLSQKISNPFSTENLVYDFKGNVIKKIITSKSIDNPEVFEIETEELTYDKNKNVISITKTNNYGRKYFDKNDFETYPLGGYPYYPFEEFEYKYNKYGHWTKKYSIIKGKKILLATRKFKK